MAKICLCLTGKTLERNLKILETYRKYIDMAELRVDCLDPDERLVIRSFPEKVDVPVILTVRRKMDGGYFENGEGSRITLLSKGLAFAEADRRRNFAFVDIEEDVEVPGLEEAARAFGTRIIRSYHNMEKTNLDLVDKLRKLRRVGDEIVKVAVLAQTLDDVIRVYRAGNETKDMKKILVSMGPLGTSTRILAEKTGSYLSYCSAPESGEPVAAPAQLNPKELTELYRFRETGEATRVFGLAGYPLAATFSPHIFNTVFSHEKIDAVYVPFPSENLESFLNLARVVNLSGAGITIPFKQEIIPHLLNVSPDVRAAGACNTIVRADNEEEDAQLLGDGWNHPGWNGFNTDAPGFSESLLGFMKKNHFGGKGITVIGAGGAARAVVSEIARLKGKCLILNRNPARAKELAAPYRFKWGGLDGQGLNMMDRFSRIIIQTTPVGTFPHIEDDPFELYCFTGKETVMDLIYKPQKTAFLKRAEAAGCRTLNGFDMLIRQAKYQYRYFCGRDFPEELIPRIENITKQYYSETI